MSQHADGPRSMPETLVPKGKDARTAKSTHESKLHILLGLEQHGGKAQDLRSLPKPEGNVFLIKAGLNPLKLGSGLSLAMGRLKSQALSIPTREYFISALQLHNWPGAC